VNLRDASESVGPDGPDVDSLTRAQWLTLTAEPAVAPPARQRAPRLPALPPRPAWHARANCRGLDPALFYAERGGDTDTPKAVCRGCVVREPCLEDALARAERFGIWGGMATRERKRLNGARARQAAAS
jgi:WhiB family redox-sensing transcriptional regulator